jgi:peroxiredoxin Q/BCP
MKTSRFYWLLAVIFAMTAIPLLAKASLEIGDQAPQFTGHNQDGKKWKLSSEIGKSIVLLYFYPKDDTRGGAMEACGLRDKMVDLKLRDVTVVGISFDSVTSHKNFAFKYNLNFPLLADTTGKIADAYGARLAPDKKMARPVSFLIGLDGKIIHITDSPDPETHLHEMQVAIEHLNGNAFP